MIKRKAENKYVYMVSKHHVIRPSYIWHKLLHISKEVL